MACPGGLEAPNSRTGGLTDDLASAASGTGEAADRTAPRHHQSFRVHVCAPHWETWQPAAGLVRSDSNPQRNRGAHLGGTHRTDRRMGPTLSTKLERYYNNKRCSELGVLGVGAAPYFLNVLRSSVFICLGVGPCQVQYQIINCICV